MGLKTLSIDGFRNFIDVAINCSDHFNLLFGANGAGKTNILEAIYYLGMGKSFRCHLLQHLVNYSRNDFTLYGQVEDVVSEQVSTIGIGRTLAGNGQLHLNGKKIFSFTEITKLLPMVILNQDSYQIITEGPKYRRQLLDWGSFHVERMPFSLWKNYGRALQQRNLALKQKLPKEEISFWGKEIAALGTTLDYARQAYFEKLKHLIVQTLEDFFQKYVIDIKYHPGWDKNYQLSDLLEQNINHDLRFGFTALGPHRADISFTIGKSPLQHVLSRGEQKLFLIAIYLAQVNLLKEYTKLRPLFLIDDLMAELDQGMQQIALRALENNYAQFFIAGVELEILKKRKTIDSASLFHVELGKINNIFQN
ncbi:MAG: DNA replication/repair protein RecF [Gammaproteobacteria bacterium]